MTTYGNDFGLRKWLKIKQLPPPYGEFLACGAGVFSLLGVVWMLRLLNKPNNKNLNKTNTPMKKNYLAPAIEQESVVVEQGIAASYTVGVQDLIYDGEDEYLM